MDVALIISFAAIAFAAWYAVCVAIYWRHTLDKAEKVSAAVIACLAVLASVVVGILAFS